MEPTKQLDYLDALELKLSKLVIDNDGKIKVEQFARIAGKSTSLVYKAASPNDDTPFPVAWLPAFMNLTQDYDVLDLLCRLTGHLPAVKEPSYKLEKEDELQICRRFIKWTHRISEEFEDLLGRPSKESLKDYKNTAQTAIKEILSSIYYAEKALKGNGELGL